MKEGPSAPRSQHAGGGGRERNSRVAEEPDVVPEPEVAARDRADAGARALLRLAEGQRLGRDRPVLAAPVERDLGRGVARVRVQALALVVHVRAVDVLPERVRRVRRRGDDRRARVDDRVERVRNVLPVDRDRAAADLPEAVVRRDGVVLDVAAVERAVRAAAVQLRAGGRELEAEAALLRGPLRDRGEEEGVVLQVRDRGEREAEEAVGGVALELGRLLRHSSEVLAGGLDAADGDCMRVYASAAALSTRQSQTERTGVSVGSAGGGGAVAVADGEAAALLLAGVRRVVLVVRAAGGARLGRDPEVGGAGVEVDGELLLVRADRDLARPEEVVLLVGERDAGALRVLGEPRDGLDGRALVERLLSDILLEVDQVLTVLAMEGGKEGRVSIKMRRQRRREGGRTSERGRAHGRPSRR